MSKNTQSNIQSNTQSTQRRRGPMGGGPGMMSNEKAKNFRGTIKKLIRYCNKYILLIIIALVAAVAGTIFEVIGPDKFRELIDLIRDNYVSGIDLSAIASIGIYLVCIYSVSVVLKFAQNFIMATVTQKISKNMRTDISKKINKLPFSYYNQTSYGDVLSRVTNDVDTIGQTLNQSVGTLVVATTMLIGSIVMMFITNWLMALTAMGASIIGVAFMMAIVMKSQKHFTAQQTELGDINGHIEEIYTGHNIVKAYNASGAAKKTFESINAKLYKSAWKSQFLSSLMLPLMIFVGNLGYVAVCVVGAVLTMQDAISFGVIGAFIIYVNLFTQPLSQLAQVANNLQRAAAASERVFEFLKEKELEDESGKTETLSNVEGNVEFKDIKFGYTPDKIVINDFSVSVKAGQKVAIVGPTGAGKTTMVNLLMRFYEVDGGEITLDGVKTNEVTRESIHEQFCMVLQDTWLFEGTIKENIIYSKESVTDDEVITACKTVGLHHFIQTLPDGYNTVLNDKASLSEGQKQLLTIARAIIKNSPLLILDEATSSVDTRTERIVQAAMDKLMEGRTSFVIAHRLSTIKNADLILVMKNGGIAESGNHNELLLKGGFYSQLYNSQFETE